MDFPEESFDIIWAEGSIYIIGFEKGLLEWKPMLKKGGYVAASELTWLKKDIPEELKSFFNHPFPHISGYELNAEKINLFSL